MVFSTTCICHTIGQSRAVTPQNTTHTHTPTGKQTSQHATALTTYRSAITSKRRRTHRFCRPESTCARPGRFLRQCAFFCYRRSPPSSDNSPGPRFRSKCLMHTNDANKNQHTHVQKTAISLGTTYIYLFTNIRARTHAENVVARQATGIPTSCILNAQISNTQYGRGCRRCCCYCCCFRPPPEREYLGHFSVYAALESPGRSTVGRRRTLSADCCRTQSDTWCAVQPFFCRNRDTTRTRAKWCRPGFD